MVFSTLVVYWIILFVGTSLPVQSVPSLGIGGDKVAHFFAYLILSVLLYLTFIFQEKFRFAQRNAVQLTLAIAIIYGVLDEIHQMLVPGRSAELLDWIADSIGSVCGVLIISFFLKKFKKQAETV
ncbi:MAG: VanZ family protein [Ignavibacteria bacterium]|nr:VanZ family protein [Ignavibacteria bacterium]